MTSQINRPRADQNSTMSSGTALPVCEEMLNTYDRPKQTHKHTECRRVELARTKLVSVWHLCGARARARPRPWGHTARLLPQLSVQGLNHSREAPARLVQINIARAQARAHGLLDRRTEHMCWVSVRAGGVLVAVRRPGEDGTAARSASSPAGHRRSRARRRGRVPHRESALKHGERRRALTANPRHEQISVLRKDNNKS